MPFTWFYGNRQFQATAGVDALPAHEGSLKLLRSDVFSGALVKDTRTVVLDDTVPSVSLSLNSSIHTQVNLDDYLNRGLSIVSRLPDPAVQTTQFVSESVARVVARHAMNAFFELSSIYCGEGIREVLSATTKDSEGINGCLAASLDCHVGREVSIRLADICRKVAAEHDAMASVMSLDEASAYLFTRFTGNGRLVALVKLLLRTGKLLREDRRNIYVVKKGLEASMRSFSFLWSDVIKEARRLIDVAKEMIGGAEVQEIDFWALVERMSNAITRPSIALDAVVAVALAELGIVVNCRPEGISVLRAITGESAEIMTKPVTLTNPGSVWISPFRALSTQRVVVALDGRTQLRMVDDVSGVSGTLGLFTMCNFAESEFLVCEPLPYCHVEDIKSTIGEAFTALARDGEEWNDGLEKILRELSSRAVPPDGREVDSAVTAARESYARNNVLAEKYVNVIFSVERIVSVFTLGVEQGRRFGDVLYQYTLFMVHPDISKVGPKTVREVWDNVEEVSLVLRRLLENVRLTYEGWIVYPKSGFSGLRHVRRRYTNWYSVWFGYARSGFNHANLAADGAAASATDREVD